MYIMIMYLEINAHIFKFACRTNCRHIICFKSAFLNKHHPLPYAMWEIGYPLSSLKSYKEVAELMAADGKQRLSKSGMQNCRRLPPNLIMGEDCLWINSHAKKNCDHAPKLPNHLNTNRVVN